jgi:hypothetical protein
MCAAFIDFDGFSLPAAPAAPTVCITEAILADE